MGRFARPRSALFACGTAAIVAGVIASFFWPSWLIAYLQQLHAKVILFFGTVGVVFACAVLVWHVVWLPEPLRYVANTGRAILMLSLVWIAAPAIQLPERTSVEPVADSFIPRIEIDFATLSHPSPTILITTVTALFMIGLLYVGVAIYEKENGPIFG